MAAGDRLLDTSGNILLDDPGNRELDDDAGNACCCTVADCCAAGETQPTHFLLTFAGYSFETTCECVLGSPNSVKFSGSGLGASVGGFASWGGTFCVPFAPNPLENLCRWEYVESPAANLIEENYHGGCPPGCTGAYDDPGDFVVTLDLVSFGNWIAEVSNSATGTALLFVDITAATCADLVGTWPDSSGNGGVDPRVTISIGC